MKCSERKRRARYSKGPERAFDPSTSVKCSSTNLEIGVALRPSLSPPRSLQGAAEKDGHSPGTQAEAWGRWSAHHADPARARLYFLQARALGVFTLSDRRGLGRETFDTLLAILGQAGKLCGAGDARQQSEDQMPNHSLGELLVPTDKARARLMLEGAWPRMPSGLLESRAALEMQGAERRIPPGQSLVPAGRWPPKVTLIARCSPLLGHKQCR